MKMVLLSKTYIDENGKESITFVRADTDFEAKFFNTTGIVVDNDYKKNTYQIYPIAFVNGYPRLGDLIEKGKEETLSISEIERKIEKLQAIG